MPSLVRALANEFKASARRATNLIRGPVFPSYGGQGDTFGGFGYQSLTQIFRSSRDIDYAVELGDLSLSSLVMAAVNFLGTALAEAPLQVVEPNADGDATPVLDHDLVALLNDPNEFYDGSVLWQAWALSWICDGNAYFWKIRSARGKVVELWYIPHTMLWPRWSSNRKGSFIDWYDYRPEGASNRIEVEDIIHFRNGLDNERNGRLGYPPLRSILKDIFTDEQAAAFSAALMNNYGVPGVILSPPAPTGQNAPPVRISPEDRLALKEHYQEKTTGRNRGQAIVLGNPMQVQPLTLDPQKLDLTRLRRVPVERVMALLGLNAIAIGLDMESSAKYSNYAEARDAAYESCVVRAQGFIRRTLDRQLLTDFEGDLRNSFNKRTPKRHVVFDLSDVRALQPDFTALYSRETQALSAGAQTLNQTLIALGKPEIGPAGDVHFIPNTVTIVKESDLDALASAKLEAATAAQQPAGMIDAGRGAKPVSAKPPTEKPSQARKSLPFEYEMLLARLSRKDPPMDEPAAHTALVQVTASEHKFSSAQVALPEVFRKKMLGFTLGEVLATHVSEDGVELNSHVTILYGLHEQDGQVMRRFLQDEAPVSLTFGQTEIFETPDADVLYVEVISEDLLRLNKLLRENFAFTSTFDSYVPHATLAYLQPGKGRLYTGRDFMAGATTTLDQVTFISREHEQTIIALQGKRPYRNGKAHLSDYQALLATEQQAQEWWKQPIAG